MMTIQVVALDHSRWGRCYQACAKDRSGIVIYWLSKDGWIPCARQNVRRYSKFKTQEAAERAANDAIVAKGGGR